MQRFLVVALAACGSSPQGPNPSPVVERAPIESPDAPQVRSLNERIGNVATDRDSRCGAVFDLFMRYVQPNMTGPEVARVVTEHAWIVVDDPITVLGGKLPIELNDQDSDVVVHCYAKPTPELNNQLWSDWVIYARISGRSAPTFKSLLAAGRDVRLIEYALMSPDGRIQRFR